MSIAIITASWKRPEVFLSFLNNTNKYNHAGIYCAGSPRDDCGHFAPKLCNYERVPNIMGSKWNHAVRMAHKSDATHFLILGSDDFISPNLWKYYQTLKGDHYALLDMYFSDGERTAYLPGYSGKHVGTPIGAGRLVSRNAMEAIQWKPFINTLARGLDSCFHRKLNEAGIECTKLWMKDTGGILVDLKSPVSMNDFEKVTRKHECVMMPDGWLDTNFV